MVSVVLLGLWSQLATAQIAIVRNSVTARDHEFRVTKVEVNADIKDQVATVQMAQTFQNVSKRTLETQFLFPLPNGAAISGLTLIVDGKELPGELKRKEEARREYEEIVRRRQDPALLEYIDHGLFKTSVFPIPAGKTRRVEIRYTELLRNDTGLVDFTLPLGITKHAQVAIEDMTVVARIRSQKDLRNIYSPTHDFDINRPGEKRANCKLTLKNVSQPNDIRLLYGTRGSDIGMDLVTYQPDTDEQGYFLLLANPRVKAKSDQILPKTVLFVVDKSGSMAGEKLEQAKASLQYMINSLHEKDTFNIVAYSSQVDLFRPEIEVVTAETKKAALEYVEDIYSGGGTNINEALTTALEQLADRKRPNYVMFLTDGLPTVGETSEATIAAQVRRANKTNARVFSFGVGYDVNSRLLDRLSRDQRGTSVYVKPEEDIEVAATNLFRKVSSPAMTDVKVRFVGPQDTPRKTVNRVYPADLPDLFRGEQLVVVGRYRKPGSVTVNMTGTVGDKVRDLNLEAELGTAKATRRNGFVATLWATRRIGQIIDDLDLNGHNKELVEELVALSLRYGIMTPYTSFLADEETPFSDRDRLLTEAEGRATDGLSAASGQGGFSQRRFKQSLLGAQRAGSSSSLSREALREEELTKRFGVASPGAQAGGFGGFAFNGGRKPSTASGGEVADESKAAAGSGQSQPIKRIGAKTFYWKNNEWLDADISGLEKMPKDKDVTKITQFTREYFELAQAENGRWKKYLSLSEPVFVMLGKRAYRIVPPVSK